MPTSADDLDRLARTCDYHAAQTSGMELAKSAVSGLLDAPNLHFRAGAESASERIESLITYHRAEYRAATERYTEAVMAAPMRTRLAHQRRRSL